LQLVAERVVGRSNDRVSNLYERHWRKCLVQSLLTPASPRLLTLSTAGGKEGKKLKIVFTIDKPTVP